MSRAGVMTLLIVLLNLVLLLLPKPVLSSPVTGIKCSKAVPMVTPCLDYVRDKANEPSKACCSGIKDLNAYCKNKGDRQAACECLKKAVGNTKIDVPRVLKLPHKCGMTSFLYGVNVDVDCKKVP
ncbi:non-specific lipid-transfer protein 4.1 [Ricinus communis]|uniref:Non-specific lipid-transfer protein n=1 Tax=Ricinus communis TaxID=3988 RepID=B9SBJ1_RICCO|nr:non-specific lipid-transfer protein 4.1 [Ricinus communis]EEF39076.1 Nonspecific lipid-transfer protein precursor, putative [Ricinus communis]|eukprot:XP_002523360.1 non-specific lipid-transfer protein 4.1 [Ricinus communis]